MPSYKIVYGDWTFKADAIGNNEALSRSLETKVDALMKKGWSCSGGVAIFSSEGVVYNMYQAMVKI